MAPRITFADKNTGDQHFASEVNEVKDKCNNPGKAIAFTTSIPADDEYYFPDYTQTGALNFTKDVGVVDNEGYGNGIEGLIISNGDNITFTTDFVMKVDTLTSGETYKFWAEWDGLKFVGGMSNMNVDSGEKAETPTNFRTSSVGQTTADLIWDSVDSDNYILQRATQSDYSDATQIYSNTDVFYQDTGRTAGTTYYYRVKNQKAGLNDSDWATLTVTTNSLSQLSSVDNFFAVSGDLSAFVSWNDVSETADSFRLERDTNPDFSGATILLDFSDPKVLLYSDSPLTNGITYYYRIKARKSGFTDSQFTSDFTTPLADTVFVADKFEGTSIDTDTWNIETNSTRNESVADGLLKLELISADPSDEPLGLQSKNQYSYKELVINVKVYKYSLVSAGDAANANYKVLLSKENFDSDNRTQFTKGSVDETYSRFIVKEDGVNVIADEFSVTQPLRVKIKYDFVNKIAYGYYWDGTSWTLINSNAYDIGAKNIIRIAEQSLTSGAFSKYVDAYISNFDYATEIPGTQSSLISQLVSYWKLDAATGANRADSQSGNVLADNNTVAQTSGKLGNAALFVSSSSQYLNIASNKELQMGDIDFTVAGWIYLTDKTTGRFFLSKAASDILIEYQLFYSQSADQFAFRVSNDGSTVATVNASTFGSPSLNTWYYLIAEHDAANNFIRISVNDGTLDALAHNTGVYVGTGDFEIGRRTSALPLYHNGKADGFGIWKRLLTSGEKTSLYNAGSGLDYPFI